MRRGDTIVVGAGAAAVLAPPPPPPALTVGQQFHDFLRSREAQRLYVAPPAGAPSGPAPAPGPAGVAPHSGSSRLLRVCSKLGLSTVAKVRAPATGGRRHIAGYLDKNAH